MAHPLQYRIEVGAWSFWARNIDGDEYLSKPWKITAELPLDPQTMTGPPEAFDPDEVIKEEVRILLERDGVLQRQIKGVITHAELTATLDGVPEVSLTMEPRYGLLEWRRDVRIHRNLNVPEIVKEVCEALGVKIEWRLRDSYDKRPYCVQWRETDLDYCNRLLEDEGIFYFFTAEDVMVLGDNPGAYDSLPGDPLLPFRETAGSDEQGDCVHDIGSRAKLTAGMVTLRDWNTEHPSLDMDVSCDTAVTDGPEWYDYPGEYEEPSEGRRKVRLHAEAFDRTGAASTGRTTSGRFYPGATFKLSGCPLPSEDGGYVIRGVSHAWNRDTEGFELGFEADREDHIFRPARQTYVPRILNPHTATVCVSYPGEDIYCDHFGRVKVHFHWDRLRPYDDDASHWVPSLQDNTGGSSAIPRENWEVVVHYLEGDPDRPIIIGRVFNPEDRFSEKLPEMKQRTSIKSETTPTRDGNNEIRFDDAAGMESIFSHAEKDQTIEVANNQDIDVGSNDNSTVKNNETVNIGTDSKWTIGGDLDWEVEGNQDWTVGADRKLTVKMSDNKTVVGNYDLTIGGSHEIEAGNAMAIAAKNMVETLQSNLDEKCKSTHQTDIAGTFNLTIGGTKMETAKLAKVDQCSKERKETVGGSKIIICDGEYQMKVDDKRTHTITGAVFAMAKKELTLTGAKKYKTFSPISVYNGSTDLTLKVKDTVVMMKGGQLKIDAPETISILISGPANQGAAKSSQN